MITFERHPSTYKHWQLEVLDSVATLTMSVDENGGINPGYSLKLNSYDLGVDIELADAIERIRFEHPEVKVVKLSSKTDKVFCAGANIMMLGLSAHAFKVNFCKFTNETRLHMEEASATSGIKFLAALNGIAAGGGYELALACDRIALVDDGNSAVSLPEVPLLGVLPGTGGLTRLVEKRKVRRDLSDVFCTLAEGVRGKRSVEWNLVDTVIPKGRWEAGVDEEVAELKNLSNRTGGPAIKLEKLDYKENANGFSYSHVFVELDEAQRKAMLTLRAPSTTTDSLDEVHQQGSNWWPLQVYRELNDAILRLRFNFPTLGLWILETEGCVENILAAEKVLLKYGQGQHLDCFVGETLSFVKRTLRKLDVSSRTLIAKVEPDSAYAGSFSELLLAADRTYMLDDSESELNSRIFLSEINNGLLSMENGLSRLQARFYGDDAKVKSIVTASKDQFFDAKDCAELGLVTFVCDEIDYSDEVRLFEEERASLSPDSLVGMEANLRFVGPENIGTKIFGRLSAWQNWIFTRENACGEKGALTNYSKPTRPEFDWNRC